MHGSNKLFSFTTLFVALIAIFPSVSQAVMGDEQLQHQQEQQQAIQAATAALQGLAGGNIGQAISGAAAPYLVEVIHKMTTTRDANGKEVVNREANLMAHAVVGAVTAYAAGNSALAGASGAAMGEYIAQQLYPDVKREDLSEEQRQTISALGTLAAGLAGGVIGDGTADAVAGAQAGKNAVENNWLNVQEADRKKQLETKRDYLKQELTPAEAKELATIDQTGKTRDEAIKAVCTDSNKGGSACGAMVGPAQEALKKYGENVSYSLIYKDLYPHEAANLEKILQGMDAGSISRDQAITAIAASTHRDWDDVAKDYDSAMQTQAIAVALAGIKGFSNETSSVKEAESFLVEKIKENVATSQKARESSNFSKYSKAEGAVQENLGIWPPNRGAYGPVEQITLPTGTVIDRYGSTRGTFTSPVGTPFENRALPSYSANAPYNVYEVLMPIDDVSKSKILPWFGQPGQGTQYELPKTVKWYLDKGYLGDKNEKRKIN